jgi:hypothetical protein
MKGLSFYMIGYQGERNLTSIWVGVHPEKLSHNGLPVDGAPVAVGLLETMSETPEGRNVHTCI